MSKTYARTFSAGAGVSGHGARDTPFSDCDALLTPIEITLWPFVFSLLATLGLAWLAVGGQRSTFAPSASIRSDTVAFSSSILSRNPRTSVLISPKSERMCPTSDSTRAMRASGPLPMAFPCCVPPPAFYRAAASRSEPISTVRRRKTNIIVSRRDGDKCSPAPKDRRFHAALRDE